MAKDQETVSKQETSKPVEPKKEESKKPKAAFFISRKHAGLTVQVQKQVKNSVTGKDDQEVAEQESFTQYYDTYKGDVVRVGYLRTESPKIAETLRNDANVEEIDEKEYSQAVEGDKNHKPLAKAPVPAA